jgi:hypothetical protein
LVEGARAVGVRRLSAALGLGKRAMAGALGWVSACAGGWARAARECAGTRCWASASTLGSRLPARWAARPRWPGAGARRAGPGLLGALCLLRLGRGEGWLGRARGVGRPGEKSSWDGGKGRAMGRGSWAS